MRLELTEVLVCPDCGPDHGLIAFIDQMDGRRITTGRLDCPICEQRHPIRDGVVYLYGAELADEGNPAGAPADPGLAELSAALLGAPTGPEILLVGPGLSSVAISLADMRPLASILAYADPSFEPHERVHWIVSATDALLPMRSARLHGAVVAGAGFIDPVEAARVLVTGCRLVILAPEPETPAFLPSSPVRELASDSRAWVGVRAGA